MARKRTIQIDIVGNAKGAQNSLSSLEVTLGGIGRRFGQLLGVAGLFGLINALQEAGKAAVNMAIEFETSMAKIEGLVGASEEQVREWSQAILDLAPEVAKSPQELADTLYFVASAGVEAGREIEVLEAAAKASTAGLGDMATIADAATSAMNAYGASNLSATDAIDVIIGAVRDGKAEPEEMAGAFGRVIPIAAEMGVEFHEVAAAVAAMSNLGLDANEAVTALRGTMAALLKPSVQAEKTLKEFGTSSAELRTQLREEGLLATLVSLKDRFGENETAMAAVFGNVRALAGVLNLVGNNLGTTEAIFESMTDTTGSLDDAFGAIEETAGFKLNRAMTRLKVVGTEVGSEMLPSIVAAVENVLPGLEELLPALGEMAVALIDLTAVVSSFSFVFEGLAAITDGLTWLFTGLTSLWDDNALKQNLMLEASESLWQTLNAGEDHVTGLANALSHVARNSDLTAQDVNKLAREAGVTDEELRLVRDTLLDYARSGEIAGLTTGEIAAAFQDTAAAAEDFSPEAERLRAQMDETTESGLNVDEMLEEMGLGMDEASGEALNLRDGLYEAMRAQESLTDVLRAAADPVFNAVNSYGNYVDSLEAYEEAAKDPKTTTAELAALQLEIAENALEAQGALDQLDGQQLEDALDAVSTALGITKEDTKKLLRELGILDGKEVTTVVRVKAPILGYKTTPLGDVIPEQKGSRVFARGGIVTGPTSALIGEGGDDEAVIPLNQRGVAFLAEALRQAGIGGQVGTQVSFGNIELSSSADPEDIARAIAWRLRTAGV